MTELSRLIERLQKGIARNASYVKTIRHPHLLLISLRELNEVIGNDKVKDSVATQVSHLIMMKRRASENNAVKEDEVMLNTVLFGSPGIGKTLIGTKLAKIWYSLGYLENNKQNKDKKKQELGDLLKDLLDGGSSSNTSEDNIFAVYTFFILLLVFIAFVSMAWSFYSKFGVMWTASIILFILFIVMLGCLYLSKGSSNANSNANINKNMDKNIDKNGKNGKKGNCGGGNCDIKNGTENKSGIRNKNDTNEFGNSPIMDNIPSDDQIIKIVTRADFVDKYVGWTSPKTNKLLEENLGKVLFVDEAYSLINGAHDEFGMEALTALNLFLSQRPKEIIVIFAGYKDLLESGPYAVQPGLKRRFMWQFDCNGYDAQQLFEIFKMQLRKKGWGINKDEEILKIFQNNMDAFPAFGGDTERAGFFAELEHSRDFINDEKGLKINVLEPKHILRGILKLRENNFKDSNGNFDNPLANMMNMFSGKKPKNNNSQFDDSELMDKIVEQSSQRSYH